MQDTCVTSLHRFDFIESAAASAASASALQESDEFRDVLCRRLDEMLATYGHALSLDIFDTFLLRDNSSELSRFFDIGGRMAGAVNQPSVAGEGTLRRKAVSQIDAFLARHLGTKASYRAGPSVAGCREGSLSEIHRVASAVLTGGTAYAEAFIDVEIEYEAERLTVNRLLLEYAQMHKSRGGQVLLLTDMYMHDLHIERLLRHMDVDCGLFDAIISSADTKVSKASGGIFKVAEACLGGEHRKFVHVGDSLRGDFQKPRACGWNSLHLPIPEASIHQRREDHIRTAAMLKAEYGVVVDIEIPR